MASAPSSGGIALRTGPRRDIVCLGRFAVDFYAQQIGARLEDVTSFAKYLGGSSANTAFGCARLGLRRRCSARVGDDAHGPLSLETLAREGCDVRTCSVDPTRLTALVLLGHQGPRHVPADLLPRELRRHGGRRKRCRRGLHRAVEGAAHHRHAFLDRARAPRQPPALERARAATTCARCSTSTIARCCGDSPSAATARRASSRATRSPRTCSAILPQFDLVIGTEEEFSDRRRQHRHHRRARRGAPRHAGDAGGQARPAGLRGDRRRDSASLDDAFNGAASRSRC